VLLPLFPVANNEGMGEILDPDPVNGQGYLGWATLNILHLDDFLTRCGETEFAVFDSLGGDQPLGCLADMLSLSPEDEHFHAIVMIKVHMHAHGDHVQGLVLYFGDLLGQITLMVIVDQSEGADHFLVQIFPFLFHKGVADEIADGFGSGLIAFFFAQGVEFIEEFGIQRNTEADSFAHAGSPCNNVVYQRDDPWGASSLEDRYPSVEQISIFTTKKGKGQWMPLGITGLAP
jgi:hypothetical protein